MALGMGPATNPRAASPLPDDGTALSVCGGAAVIPRRRSAFGKRADAVEGLEVGVHRWPGGRRAGGAHRRHRAGLLKVPEVRRAARPGWGALPLPQESGPRRQHPRFCKMPDAEAEALSGGLGWSVSRGAVQVLGIAFRRPLKLFRPTHLGVQLRDFAPSGLTRQGSTAPMRLAATVAPAFVANSATGCTAFGLYDVASGGLGLSAPLAGAAAGVGSSLLTTPLEAVKFNVRRRGGGGVWRAARAVRVRQLRCCAGAVAAREAVSLGTFFGIYALEAPAAGEAGSIGRTVAAGVAASLMATVAGAPFNVLKWWRLQPVKPPAQPARSSLRLQAAGGARTAVAMALPAANRRPRRAAAGAEGGAGRRRARHVQASEKAPAAGAAGGG